MITYGSTRTTPKNPDEPWYAQKYKSTRPKSNPKTKEQKTSVNYQTARRAQARRGRAANIRQARPYADGYNQYVPATGTTMYRPPTVARYSPYRPVTRWTDVPLNEAGATATYQTAFRDPSSRIPQPGMNTRFINANDLRTSPYGEEYDQQLNAYRRIFGSGFTGPWMEGVMSYDQGIPYQYAQPQQQQGLPSGYSGYGNLGSYGGYGSYGGGRGYGGGGGGGGYTASSKSPWQDYAANWVQAVANWRI